MGSPYVERGRSTRFGLNRFSWKSTDRLTVVDDPDLDVGNFGLNDKLALVRFQLDEDSSNEQ